MKKVLLFLVICGALNATTLKSMLSSSKVKNDSLLAKKIEILSSNKAVDAIDASYKPTVDIEAFATNQNPRNFMRAGATYGLSAKLNYIVFDGGVKKSIKRQKEFELLSKIFASKQFEKSIELKIVQDYFALKSLNALIGSLKSKQASIRSHLKKVKLLTASDMLAKSELYRLQASLEMLKYNISSLKLQQKSLLSSLSLHSGLRVKAIGNSHFLKKRVSFEASSEIRALLAQSAAIRSGAAAIGSQNNPKLNLALDYSIYGYGRDDLMHPKGLDKQAKVTLGASMRVYDGGATKANSEAQKLRAIAVAIEAKYKLKEQKNSFNIAKARIKTIKSKIKSARATLKAAKKYLNEMEQKFSAGFVDSSYYLDALSQKVQADAEYKRAINDLEVAYALYYYYGGKNIKGYIR